MKYLLFLILIFSISCSDNKENIVPNYPYDEVTLAVYPWKKDVNVKITAITDEENLEFEINNDIVNIPFKTKNGFTFIATCIDPENRITLVVRDKKTAKVLKSIDGYSLVRITSK